VSIGAISESKRGEAFLGGVRKGQSKGVFKRGLKSPLFFNLKGRRAGKDINGAGL